MTQPVTGSGQPEPGRGPDRSWVRVGHQSSGAAGLLAGLAHTASVGLKIRGGTLEARHPTWMLVAVGVALMACGIWGLLASRRRSGTHGSHRAPLATGALLVLVLSVALLFREPRGLPLAVVPLLALIGELRGGGKRTGPS